MSTVRMSPIIGIAGPARSGKDTVAQFLLASRGGYTYSLADPIRGMLRAIGVDMKDPYWLNRKEEVIPAFGVSPRRLMQTLGTEWGRETINKDIWITLAKQNFLLNGQGMVVPDVRFDDEAEWVRSYGGVVIHLERSKRPLVEEHASENGIKKEDKDITIANSGTLEELQQAIEEILDVKY